MGFAQKTSRHQGAPAVCPYVHHDQLTRMLPEVGMVRKYILKTSNLHFPKILWRGRGRQIRPALYLKWVNLYILKTANHAKAKLSVGGAYELYLPPSTHPLHTLYIGPVDGSNTQYMKRVVGGRMDWWLGGLSTYTLPS